MTYENYSSNETRKIICNMLENKLSNYFLYIVNHITLLLNKYYYSLWKLLNLVNILINK
jgi:hypothetical protein